MILMGAGFGWIDFSNEQRDKVFSVIELLNTGGTDFTPMGSKIIFENNFLFLKIISCYNI